MKQEDRRQFVSLVEILASSFGKDPSEQMVTGFWIGLQDMALGEVNSGIREALRSCEHMPRPAHIRKLAGKGRLGPDHRAALAWQFVRDAINRHGTYKSVDFDDPIINSTIRNMGGWVALGKKSAEAFDVWTRKEFERIYQTISLAGASEDSIEYLPGISEAENQGLYEVPPPSKIPTNYDKATLRVLPSPKMDTTILTLLDGGGRGQENQCEAQRQSARTEDKTFTGTVGV